MRQTSITRLLRPDEKIATAYGRVPVLDWLESEKNRMKGMGFWRSQSIDFHDGLVHLVGIPNKGLPEKICHVTNEEASHAA